MLGKILFIKQAINIPFLYTPDFDNNGSYDAIPLCTSLRVWKTRRREFPAQGRDDLIKQMIANAFKIPD